jgi:hypothetical protein
VHGCAGSAFRLLNTPFGLDLKPHVGRVTSTVTSGARLLALRYLAPPTIVRATT